MNTNPFRRPSKFRFRSLICVGLLATVIEGCAVASGDQSTRSASGQTVQAQRPNANSVIAQSGLAPGHYCRINSVPGGVPGVDGQPGDGMKLAGRIIEMDEKRIVLGDVICISAFPAVAEGQPTKKEASLGLLSGLAPRTFKKSGVGHSSMPLDGELTIDRSTITMINPVDGTNWDVARQSGQWFERIGVDFDFDGQKQVMRTQVARVGPGTDAAVDAGYELEDLLNSSMPAVEHYDPAAEGIKASSLTSGLKQPSARKPYMSVEALNGQSSGMR